MAGIYIHIPFCKSKCNYCDFYSATNDNRIDVFVNSLLLEIELRKGYLENETISTIYFGGGTPSQLSTNYYQIILEKIKTFFTLTENCEITFEGNPDDLSSKYLSELFALGINRLSMGVQSFHDDELLAINRRHTAKKAVEMVETAQKVGFQNISIDLIYGLPNQTIEKWQYNIDLALKLPIQHISVYGLSYELGTPLWQSLQKGQVKQTDDETMNKMYEILIKKCQGADFEQYEISNFAKKGFHSRHNSSCWNMTKYLGLGASAHSFNGKSRQWNVASLKKYSELVATNGKYFDKENLTKKDIVNEFIMLSLRTKEGLDLKELEKISETSTCEELKTSVQKYILTNYLQLKGNKLSLTFEGILISNQIISDLMLE